MVKITFPDGNIREYNKGVTGYEIAKSISDRLAKEVLSVTVNDNIWDLTRPIDTDATVKLHKWDDEEAKHAFWHSSAHLMAEAIESLYPGVKLGIGPSIENGFYYDIDFGDHTISDSDFPKIEKKMQEIVQAKEPITRKEVSKEEALNTYKKKGDPYKVELITDLEDGTITFYSQGNFTDLCRGPHLPDTSYIKAFKLLSIAGAYWRGNENNNQLTRFYGISLPKQGLLDEYLVMLD